MRTEFGMSFTLTRRAIETKRAWRLFGYQVSNALVRAWDKKYDWRTRTIWLSKPDDVCRCTFQIDYEWAKTPEEQVRLYVLVEFCELGFCGPADSPEWKQAGEAILAMFRTGRPRTYYDEDIRVYRFYDEDDETFYDRARMPLPTFEASELIDGELFPRTAII